MLRFISPLRVPRTKGCKLFSYCSTARGFFFAAAAYHPMGVRGYKNGPNLNTLRRSSGSPKLPNSLKDPDEEATPLDRHQLVELFSGKFPADFSGEVINVPTTQNQYHALVNAFNQARPESEYVTTTSQSRSLALDRLVHMLTLHSLFE